MDLSGCKCLDLFLTNQIALRLFKSTELTLYTDNEGLDQSVRKRIRRLT